MIEAVARNVPAGLGAPVFDKLEADLAKGCMSLPASKGFEVILEDSPTVPSYELSARIFRRLDRAFQEH